MTVASQTRLAVKIIAGTLLFVGLIFGFIERRYAPNAIVTDDSTILPAWVGWSGWILSALATVAYVLMDILEWRARPP
jgi:hypothetical protein